MSYEIGHIIWHGGQELTIKSEPFEQFGAMWQYAEEEGGATRVVATPEQKEENAKRERDAWHRQQKGFRRLHEATKNA
ncbi:MAG TPA: hypothetical protein VKP65_16960 [Rhodothermales bacterium]|nr:hypothetical protein [Rhodothermales bacterium]